MNNVLIIYHATDFDGKCSAAVVNKAYEKATLYGWDHYQEIDWDLIRSFDVIFMVDISFPDKRDMKYLRDNFVFFWIDHHSESIKKYKDMMIPGLQENGKGACQLCWEYLFPNIIIPKPVKLLADYDIWKHEDKDTVYFQYGMRMYGIEADNHQTWKELFEYGRIYSAIKEDGRTAFKYQEQSNKVHAKSSFIVEDFCGHRAIALNSTPGSSIVFESVGGKDFDVMIIFGFSGENWKVTMYNDNGNVNVGEIATKFFGGGHKEAAGFKCDTAKMIEFGLIK